MPITNIISIISIVVSVLALIVSAVTAWLTLIHKGRIKMSQPTQIYFGPERHSKTACKVFFCTLLYVTGKRGHVIENMFVRLRRGETQQNFNIWVYGDADLRRGSGLFIPETGLTTNHHFLLPPDGTTFQFLPGYYSLDVFATEIRHKVFATEIRRKPELLFSVGPLEITQELFNQFNKPGCGLYFDWGPDAGRYFARVLPMPETKFPALLREMVPEQEGRA
jgi:hypothetical protein